MAKRASRDKPKTPSLDDIEANHSWSMVRSALDKLHEGGKPTAREMQYYRAWYQSLVGKAVDKAFREVPNSTYQSWCEVSVPTIYAHHAAFGIPCKGRFVSIPAIVNTFHNLLAEKGRILNAASTGADIEDSAMQRKRAADADMSEDERDKRRGFLVPASQVHSSHVQWANRLRKASEQLGRKFGAMAQRILDDALADCEKHVANMLNDK